jgi:hypothetical protein
MRADLPPLPPRMQHLPIDARGFPVPFFVAWIDGVPDHRIADPKKFELAVRFRRCWVCGEQMGRFCAYVIGPMCAVNRVSADPPMHRECAEYSVRVCPFLTRPHARRRTDALTENGESRGIPILRNPGVALLWVTRTGRSNAHHEGAALLHRGARGSATVVRRRPEGHARGGASLLRDWLSGAPEGGRERRA